MTSHQLLVHTMNTMVLEHPWFISNHVNSETLRIRFCNLHASCGHPIICQVKCQLSYCSLHANILALISVHSGPSNREDQLAAAAGAAAQIGRINLKVMTVTKPCDMIQDNYGVTQFCLKFYVYSLDDFGSRFYLGQASLGLRGEQLDLAMLFAIQLIPMKSFALGRSAVPQRLGKSWKQSWKRLRLVW